MKQAVIKALTMLLWAITALLAGYEVFLTRHIVRYLYLRLFDIFFFPPSITERLSATAVGNIAALVMAVFAIAIVVGGFDYHWMHAGTKKSLRIFGATVIFELVILIIYISKFYIVKYIICI